MKKGTKLETAMRYLLVCAIFASPMLPASAQGAFQTSGPNQELDQSSAPLFTQPNHYQDLRQHCFFAGDYRNPVTISVGYNEQPLFYYDDPIIQTVYPGPTPISTGLIGNDINTTVNGSVPGLVNTAVAGAVIGGASVVGSAVSGFGSGSGSAMNMSGSGTSASVSGTVLDGTQF
ncbi:MAG: hypothetical protein JST01_04790 [Cyanobacteria bacterium SZAS TMP-1]|nr:hypothetical protein [Cyanobacteria bacterium SZAS TMP-1]